MTSIKRTPMTSTKRTPKKKAKKVPKSLKNQPSIYKKKLIVTAIPWDGTIEHICKIAELFPKMQFSIRFNGILVFEILTDYGMKRVKSKNYIVEGFNAENTIYYPISEGSFLNSYEGCNDDKD